MKNISFCNRKKLLVPILLFFLNLRVFSQIYSSQQLIPAGHWLYDALFSLNAEVHHISFGTNAPLSVGELKMYFQEIPYEKLSDSGKTLYDKAMSFFEPKNVLFPLGPVYTSFDLNFHPNLLYKSSSDIDWSFATDYTGHILTNGVVKNADLTAISAEKGKTYKNPYVNEKGEPIEPPDYGAASSFYGSDFSNAFVKLPISVGFSDYIFMTAEPMFSKSFWGMTDDYNFINLAYTADDFEFLWPTTAYMSVGHAFDSWGVNFSLSRQGLQIGRTQTGSIIYNSTFQTDMYAQLNLYSPNLKYNMDVVEISKNKYIYLHSIEARFFKCIKAGAVEGMLIQQPFELRFLNPLMIMHSFGTWKQYMTEDEETYYGEAHVCAYMGIHFDITPCKFLRIYGLYAQNEIQPPNELKSVSGKVFPDSLGGQLGVELNVPGGKDGRWIGTLEGIYTTPFLYIKQGADWSLYSSRYDMQSNTSLPICSWIGTPFGPDCIGLQTRLGYSVAQKWSCELDYLFVAHGTNSFGIFNNTVIIDGKEYYAYYPSVLRHEGLGTDDDLIDMARSYKLTGTVQYTNQITVKGSYMFNNHLSVLGQSVYSFIFNNKNESGKFAQGVQISVGVDYNLF